MVSLKYVRHTEWLRGRGRNSEYSKESKERLKDWLRALTDIITSTSREKRRRRRACWKQVGAGAEKEGWEGRL